MPSVVPLASPRLADPSALARPTDDLAATRSLVVAASRGDAPAFARLHHLFGRMVHAIVLRRVPAEEAPDLIQDIFLKAWRTLPGLHDPDAFGPWLASIARTRTIDFFRTRREHAELPPNINPSPPPTSEAREILEIVRSLPDAFAETLIMRLVEGMTGPEIAARTGMTEGSVRVNLHRGMTMLRARLDPEQRR